MPEGGQQNLREKARILMNEALRDLECGCYNKAVSAAYFAVRLLAESKLMGLRTRKDDKIANALYRLLLRLGEEEAEWIRRSFMKLFEARKMADHTSVSFNREEAKSLVRLAMELVERIEEVTGRAHP